MKKSLRSWLWRVPVEEEVDEELAFHIDMRARDLVAGGMDPAAARAAAAARLGDLAGVKRTCMDLGRKRDREMRITQWLDESRNDVTFATRHLKASPAFAAVAIATLALGIGANSAIFALVDAALLRPLPYAAPNRLAVISETNEKAQSTRVSPPNLIDWNDRSRAFESIGGFSRASAPW